MKKLTCVLAILAAASTAAVAKDLKQDKKSTAPTVTATQMSDAEMDKVTAAGHPTLVGQGNNTALDAGGTNLLPGETNNNSHSSHLIFPGTGVCTNPATGHCN
jgi:hypothetical protein